MIYIFHLCVFVKAYSSFSNLKLSFELKKRMIREGVGEGLRRLEKLHKMFSDTRRTRAVLAAVAYRKPINRVRETQ